MLLGKRPVSRFGLHPAVTTRDDHAARVVTAPSARAVFAFTALCTFAALAGCSRSPIRQGEGDVDLPSVCTTNADCITSNACEIRACVAGLCELEQKISCDDGDPCTLDACLPKDGSCSHSWVTSDDDGDGHFDVLPGKAPGAADACGDDCDDTSPLAYPGAYEQCDGVDNDCNGVIDDGQRYYGPTTGWPRVTRVTDATVHESMPGSLSFDGDKFAMTVLERNERWQGVFHAFGSDGTMQVPSTALTLATNDAAAGPLVWTGSVFGTVWEDRRDTSYDLYFNRLDVFGRKLHADLRLTTSDGFTIHPSLSYTGSEWLLAYADDFGTDQFEIYGRRISKDAQLLGEPVALTPSYIDARQPRLSRNADGLGLFYYSVTDRQYFYMTLTADLQAGSKPIPLPLDEPAETSIRWNGDRYIVAWTPRTETVASSVWAMTVDSSGSVRAPARALTSGARMARSPTIVAMGDRFALIWADDRFTPERFELSLQMFDNELTPIDMQQQITSLGANAIDPVGVLGGGSLGIVFRSNQAGPWQTFFTSLECWYKE